MTEFNSPVTQNKIFIVIHEVEVKHIDFFLGSTVPREGFDSSVIMPFSWCVVAVTLPI